MAAAGLVMGLWGRRCVYVCVWRKGEDRGMSVVGRYLGLETTCNEVSEDINHPIASRVTLMYAGRTMRQWRKKR